MKHSSDVVMDLARGLVRPAVTLMVVGLICYMTIAEKPIPTEVMGLATIIIGAWFGSRKNSSA